MDFQRLKYSIQLNNTAKAWQIVNKITNRKPSTTGKLKGKSPEERKQLWLKHFKNLLGNPDTSPPPEDIPQIFSNLYILDTEFTLNEIREAKKQIKEGKAPGEDGIMPATLKRIDVDEILLKFSNKLLIDGFHHQNNYLHSPSYQYPSQVTWD